MGSAITVMLSVTRLLNIALLSTLLLKTKLKTNIISRIPSSVMIFFILMLNIWLSMTVRINENIDPLNYHSTPLPYIIEIILPIIFLYLLYKNHNDFGLYIIGLYYIYGMCKSLFPSSGGIDNIGASHVKNRMFKIYDH